MFKNGVERPPLITFPHPRPMGWTIERRHEDVSQLTGEESLKGDEEAALFGPNRTGSMSSAKRRLLLTQNNLPMTGQPEAALS